MAHHKKEHTLKVCSYFFLFNFIVMIFINKIINITITKIVKIVNDNVRNGIIL